jgi:hypothetical protein
MVNTIMHVPPAHNYVSNGLTAVMAEHMSYTLIKVSDINGLLIIRKRTDNTEGIRYTLQASFRHLIHYRVLSVNLWRHRLATQRPAQHDRFIFAAT